MLVEWQRVSLTRDLDGLVGSSPSGGLLMLGPLWTAKVLIPWTRLEGERKAKKREISTLRMVKGMFVSWVPRWTGQEEVDVCCL